jgi:D-alanyl-D-alanine carboxypeptidase (penicillin-binding protein 5/6)
VLTLAACKPIDDVNLRNPDNSDEAHVGDDDPVVPIDDLEDEVLPVEPDEPEETIRFAALFGLPQTNAATAINAPFGALYNLTDDVFVYGKRVDEQVYPSGTVKLLTALVVYDMLPLDFIFTVGSETQMASGGTAGLVSGSRLDMEAILTALLIPVGNDAAYTISVNTARELSGSADAGNHEMNDYFLRLMNDYAQNLGAENSNFSNPCGFHASNNFSTVRDLTILAAAAAQNPLITAICGKIEHEVAFASGGSASWNNSNPFLALELWDIRGIRTGYTDESAFSAQILAYIDGKVYIAVVSGSPTAGERENDIIRLLQMARDGHDGDVITVFEG